jgi:enoyl-CoA hydratase / 3-hydroxyacyl-CoA dehydrogenase
LSKAYETVKVKRENALLWIILNRVHKLNAINEVLMKDLSGALDTAEKDSSVRCVVITGEDDRAFSTGADVTVFAKMTPVQAEEFSRTGQKLFGKIEEIPKPVIASINGFALGGGLELALACDFRVAAENAELGSSEIALGLIPGWGGTQRLMRIVGLAKAKEMILLGSKINAEEALKIGLVNKVVRIDKLQDEVRALAKLLSEGPPVAMKYAKYALNFGTQLPLDAGLRLESSLLGLTFSTEDFKEGLQAFISGKKPEFKGK